MNKIYLFFLLSLLSISLVSASQKQTLGNDFAQYDDINLIQGCINSTYSNITFIIYPNGTFMNLPETKMTTERDDFYNYTLNDYIEVGQTLVYGHCDPNGIRKPWAYDFVTKPKGILYVDTSSPIGIVVLILLTLGSIFFYKEGEKLYSGALLFLSGIIIVVSKINLIAGILYVVFAVIVLSQAERGKKK